MTIVSIRHSIQVFLTIRGLYSPSCCTDPLEKWSTAGTYSTNCAKGPRLSLAGLQETGFSLAYIIIIKRRLQSITSLYLPGFLYSLELEGRLWVYILATTPQVFRYLGINMYLLPLFFALALGPLLVFAGWGYTDDGSNYVIGLSQNSSSPTLPG